MKKRASSISLFLVALGILGMCIGFVEATCFSDGGADCVCGQYADLSGYGQIEVAGVKLSCSNIADGLCPEDYQEGLGGLAGALVPSCSKCHDPDCTGSVNGTVFSADIQMPLDRATVKVLPIRWDMNAPSLEKTNISVYGGKFSIDGVTTGTYYISASHQGYDTQLIETTIVRSQNTQVNFMLVNGTCFEDCTNSYGRCNAQCDGMIFNQGAGACVFRNDEIKKLCDNRLKGTEVFVSDVYGDSSHALFVKCCEGDPYLKYYDNASVSASSIRDLAKIEKSVRFNDQPAKIVIAYWPTNQ